jgi:hypothetical protein
MDLYVPLEFWFAKNSQLALPIINFNHPVKSLFFDFLSSPSLFSADEIKKLKAEREINDLCNQFNKLCIPKTYDEIINSLNDTEKQNMKNINEIEKDWYYNFINNNYDF